MNLTLGTLFKEIQSDISNLVEINVVRRAANRVIGQINDVFMGYQVDEVGVIRKLANTKEAMVFANADPDTIVTTTDISDSIRPSFVAFIFGQDRNNGRYYINSASAKTITLVGDEKLMPSELIEDSDNRDFANASEWTNVNINAYDETNDLTITADAVGQYATLPVANAPMIAAKKYRLVFDVANLVSTWTIRDFTGAQIFGTVSANGTGQSIEFTLKTLLTGGFRIVSVATNSSADFDNFSLYQIDATISIYDFKALEILEPTNALIATANANPDTITDSGVNDFEDLGAKANDIIILESTTESESGAYSVASVSGFKITLQTNESLAGVSQESMRIRIIRPSMAYSFNAENHELILPNNVKRIVKVFENNKELTKKAFDFVRDTANKSILAYAMMDRNKIKFTENVVDGADDEIRLLVEKSIPEYPGNASDTYIIIPDSMKETILAGTIMHIAMKSDFKDEEMFKFNQKSFERGLKALKLQEIERRGATSEELDYTYFPTAT